MKNCIDNVSGTKQPTPREKITMKISVLFSLHPGVSCCYIFFYRVNKPVFTYVT